MRIHFGLSVQREKPLQKIKGLGDDLLWNAMVLDVEEPTVMTSFIYTLGYRFSGFERRTVDLS